MLRRKDMLAEPVAHFSSAHYWTALSLSGSGVNEPYGLCVSHHLIRRQCRPSIPRELLYLIPWQYLKPVAMVNQSVISVGIKLVLL